MSRVSPIGSPASPPPEVQEGDGKARSKSNAPLSGYRYLLSLMRYGSLKVPDVLKPGAPIIPIDPASRFKELHREAVHLLSISHDASLKEIESNIVAFSKVREEMYGLVSVLDPNEEKHIVLLSQTFIAWQDKIVQLKQHVAGLGTREVLVTLALLNQERFNVLSLLGDLFFRYGRVADFLRVLEETFSLNSKKEVDKPTKRFLDGVLPPILSFYIDHRMLVAANGTIVRMEQYADPHLRQSLHLKHWRNLARSYAVDDSNLTYRDFNELKNTPEVPTDSILKGKLVERADDINHVLSTPQRSMSHEETAFLDMPPYDSKRNVGDLVIPEKPSDASHFYWAGVLEYVGSRTHSPFLMMRAGMSYLKKGQAVRATKSFEQVLNEGSASEKQKQEARAYLTRVVAFHANSLVAQKKPWQAALYLEAQDKKYGLRLGSQRIELYEAYAKVYAAMDEYVQSLFYYDLIIDHYNRVINRAERQSDEQVWDSPHILYPKRAQINEDISFVYFKQGKKDKAKMALQHALNDYNRILQVSDPEDEAYVSDKNDTRILAKRFVALLVLNGVSEAGRIAHEFAQNEGYHESIERAFKETMERFFIVGCKEEARFLREMYESLFDKPKEAAPANLESVLSAIEVEHSADIPVIINPDHVPVDPQLPVAVHLDQLFSFLRDVLLASDEENLGAIITRLTLLKALEEEAVRHNRFEEEWYLIQLMLRFEIEHLHRNGIPQASFVKSATVKKYERRLQDIEKAHQFRERYSFEELSVLPLPVVAGQFMMTALDSHLHVLTRLEDKLPVEKMKALYCDFINLLEALSQYFIQSNDEECPWYELLMDKAQTVREEAEACLHFLEENPVPVTEEKVEPVVVSSAPIVPKATIIPDATLNNLLSNRYVDWLRMINYPLSKPVTGADPRYTQARGYPPITDAGYQYGLAHRGFGEMGPLLVPQTHHLLYHDAKHVEVLLDRTVGEGHYDWRLEPGPAQGFYHVLTRKEGSPNTLPSFILDGDSELDVLHVHLAWMNKGEILYENHSGMSLVLRQMEEFSEKAFGSVYMAYKKRIVFHYRASDNKIDTVSFDKGSANSPHEPRPVIAKERVVESVVNSKVKVDDVVLAPLYCPVSQAQSAPNPVTALVPVSLLSAGILQGYAGIPFATWTPQAALATWQ